MRVLVQHHPSRGDVLARLVASLDMEPEVVVDPDPHAKLRSPWRTYEACMRSLGAEGGFVLQDDAVAASGLLVAAQAAVDLHPGRLIAFFHGGTPAMRLAFTNAERRGQAFTEIGGQSWVPTVALYWPPGAAASFLAYLDGRPRGLPRYWRADDGLVAEWVRKTRQAVLVTVPCLVEHPDDSPSLIGAKHRAGHNRQRVAAAYDPDGARTWGRSLANRPGSTRVSA